jgi:hypothetical protein
MMGANMASDTPKPQRRGFRILDAKTADAIVNLASSGTPMTTIADLLGVSRTSLYRWISVGQAEPDGPFGELSRAILKARAQHQMNLRGVIDEAASEDPRWAAWLLERHFPTHYGKGAQVEVHNHAPAADHKPVIDVSDKSLAELEAELDEGT